MVDVLGLIFPKEKKFYSMLEDQVENVTATTALFYNLISDFSKLTSQKRKRLVLLIQKKERLGDEIYDKGVAELKATFITPMDREDIHRLIGRIDDVVDQLEIRALKIEAFKIKKIPRDLLELVNILKGQVEDLSSCIYGLGRKKDINRYVLAVHAAERRADEVFIKGIAELFSIKADPMEVIKLKDLYESVEKTVDLTYSVVQIIENLSVKYA